MVDKHRLFLCQYPFLIIDRGRGREGGGEKGRERGREGGGEREGGREGEGGRERGRGREGGREIVLVTSKIVTIAIIMHYRQNKNINKNHAH